MAEQAPVKASEEEVRIDRRAKRPLAIAMTMFETKNYLPEIEEHNEIVKGIMNDPLNKYLELRDRLRVNGPTASFPEFKGTVSKLTQELFQNPENVAIINSDPTLLNLRELLVHTLISIQTEHRYVYPYKATILVIEEMLKILDIIARKKRADLNPYYHNLRYRLYLTYLLDQAYPDNIVFPTIFNIGSTFLIKTRCVPIQFIGVVHEPTHADQYDNSPIDFWAHDIQHGRRLIQENQRYYDIVVKHIYYYTKRSTFDFVPIEAFYKEQAAFTQFLFSLITITAAEREAAAKETNPAEKLEKEKAIAYKNIKKLIIFEVVHEKAWPITKFSLCRNIPLGYDVFPIETLVARTTTVGIKTVDDKFQDPTTLSNLYNKLRKGFYDKVISPDPRILEEKFRTAKDIAAAAQELLTQIDCTIKHSFEELLALTLDEKGAEEFTERAGEIAFPDKVDLSVLERYPTQVMGYWQAEIEAPLKTTATPDQSTGGNAPVKVTKAEGDAQGPKGGKRKTRRMPYRNRSVKS
jgi:hypothetical protein